MLSRNELIKHVLILVIVTTIAYFIWSKLFSLMELNIKEYPSFKYNSKSKTRKSDWYNYIAPLAKVVGKEFGIPWEVICVQTALETGWGKSILATKYNNFGGVKFAGSGAPSKVNMSTGEVFNGQEVTINSNFAVWNTPYEGLRGYANFFHRNKRYATALKYPNDPFRFIEEIKKAGYATAPNYVSILHGMLRNDLKIQQA
jgi:flagellum-specific peptidoglycan hydrolase FlgJ